MQKFFFFLSFLILSLPSLLGQQDSTKVQYDDTKLQVLEINEEDTRKYENDPKFDYEIVENNPTWWDDFKTWVGNLFLRLFEWIFGVEEAVGVLAAFLRVVPYLLLILLLFVLIRFFLNVNASSPSGKHQAKAFVGLSEEEQIIKHEDIQVLIQKALADKNYRLAIRYSFLYSLKLMSDKELIDWQIQKTNHDYLAEIKKPDLQKSFSKIKRIYDYTWYGDFAIDEAKYQKAETVFLQQQKMVKNG
ncbi:DUF4129 domain-containing protein [Maribacter sp. 2308TA10-17]|uniref:DUF4129 domain-containing protein n=1 Tax=Maribacter sp. 2308TA10-17 TaxID=3386276 RepID=UPI0039BD8827